MKQKFRLYGSYALGGLIYLSCSPQAILGMLCAFIYRPFIFGWETIMNAKPVSKDEGDGIE